MAQQTAVEWLLEQIEKKNGKEFASFYSEFIQEAKQMEKEQIIDAHIEGQRIFDKHPHTQWTNDQAEEYYKETYNK